MNKNAVTAWPIGINVLVGIAAFFLPRFSVGILQRPGGQRRQLAHWRRLQLRAVGAVLALWLLAFALSVVLMAEANIQLPLTPFVIGSVCGAGFFFLRGAANQPADAS